MSDTTAGRDDVFFESLRAVRDRTAELKANTSALTSRTEAVKQEAWEVRLRAKAARDWAAAVRMARQAPKAHVRADAPVRSFTLAGQLGGRSVQASWDNGRLTGDARLITHAQLLADLGTVFVNANPPARVEATLTGEPAAVMLTLARACDTVTSVESEPA
jgi:hypothetical protein